MIITHATCILRKRNAVVISTHWYLVNEGYKVFIDICVDLASLASSFKHDVIKTHDTRKPTFTKSACKNAVHMRGIR